MTQKDFRAAYLSLDEVYHVSLKLAKEIRDSGWTCNLIVAIARGGFPPARFLCDFLNIEDLQAIQVKHYASGAEEIKEAQVAHANFSGLRNKDILLVDDVNDSGESLSAAHKSLVDAKSIKTAVLHENKNTQFKADFVGERLQEWKWLIYPWAVKEDTLEFLKKDGMLDTGAEQAKNFRKERYDLEIDKDLLAELLRFKGIDGDQ